MANPAPLPSVWPTVHLGVGNSDDKLGQREWAVFLEELKDLVRRYTTKVHGWWYSEPVAPWQNAQVAFQLDPVYHTYFRAELTALRKQYLQDSVAWTEGVTEFV